MRARTRPTVPEVLPAVRAYVARPEHAAGGSLHIVLDDGNVRDVHVRHCLAAAEAAGDAAGAGLARTLLSMTRTQRLRLRAMPHPAPA